MSTNSILNGSTLDFTNKGKSHQNVWCALRVVCVSLWPRAYCTVSSSSSWREKVERSDMLDSEWRERTEMAESDRRGVPMGGWQRGTNRDESTKTSTRITQCERRVESKVDKMLLDPIGLSKIGWKSPFHLNMEDKMDFLYICNIRTSYFTYTHIIYILVFL